AFGRVGEARKVGGLLDALLLLREGGIGDAKRRRGGDELPDHWGVPRKEFGETEFYRRFRLKFHSRFLPGFNLRAQARMTLPKKVFIRTFGCQMNEYDSDKMADVLAAAEGFEKTDDPAAAD